MHQQAKSGSEVSRSDNKREQLLVAAANKILFDFRVKSICGLWWAGDIPGASPGFPCGYVSCGGYLGYCLLPGTSPTAVTFTFDLSPVWSVSTITINIKIK